MEDEQQLQNRLKSETIEIKNNASKSNPNKEESRMLSTTEIDPSDLPEEIILELKDIELPKEDPNAQKFETDEHIAIGEDAFEKFLGQLDPEEVDEVWELLALQEKEAKMYDPRVNKKVKRTLYQIALTEKLALTPGEILALAGDYFGVPGEPICFGENQDPQKSDDAKKARFIQAYTTLIDPKYQSQIEAILKYVKDQVNLNDPETQLNFKREKDSSLKSNIHFGMISKETKLPCAFWDSRYLHLARTNFDHFGKDAWEAYRIGHQCAIDTAKVAATLSAQKKRELFQRAMGLELFACHFLTDAYASGHIRTPRRQILNALLHKPLDATPNVKQVSAVKLILAGLLAKKMHDEDSMKGVHVKSKISDKSWQAYGDGAYYKPNAVDNAKRAQKAVTLGLLDVMHAFKGRSIQLTDDYIQQYLPEEDKEKNKEPLFVVNEERTAVLLRDSHQTLKASTLLHFFTAKVKQSDGKIKELKEEQQVEEEAKRLEEAKATCKVM